MSKRGSGSSTRSNGNFSGVVAIEVTTKDGTKLSYRSRQGGFITGIDDARESPASGKLTVPEIAKRMTENGATVKTYTKKQLEAHLEAIKSVALAAFSAFMTVPNKLGARQS